MSSEPTRIAIAAGLTLSLVLQLPLLMNGCAREAPRSSLPAPEYERPSSGSWPGYADAGLRVVAEQRHNASPIDSGTVGGEFDGSVPASMEKNETPKAPVTR
jgi:hypothetical protein